MRASILKILLVMGLTPFLLGAGGELPSGPPGSRDFVQYYSACALVEAGHNPYRPELVYELQKSEGFVFSQPVMMWNPPLVLPLVCPFMGGNLAGSALRWMGANLVFLLAAALLSWFAFTSDRRRLAWGLLVALLYLPAIDNIVSGQIGLLLAAGVSAFLFFIRRGRRADFAAGLSLSVLIVKPHLFHLLGLAVLWLIFAERRFKILAGIFAGAAVVTAAALAVRPMLFFDWWDAMGKTHFSVPVFTVWDWRPDAFSGYVRSLFEYSGIHRKWTAFILPVLSSCIFAAFLFLKRPFNAAALPAVICLSLLTAPYGWFSDQALLLILPVGALAILTERAAPWRRFRSTLLALVVLQVVVNFVRPAAGGFWLPLVMLAIWWRASQISSSSTATVKKCP